MEAQFNVLNFKFLTKKLKCCLKTKMQMSKELGYIKRTLDSMLEYENFDLILIESSNALKNF